MACLSVSAKDPEGLNFLSLCELVYTRADLSPEQARRLLQRRDDFQYQLRTLVMKMVEANLYDHEIKVSHYTYPDDYRAKPIDEQIKMIAAQFGIDGSQALAYAENLPPLPVGAEGWFAVPRWEAIASSYGGAVERALNLLSQQRSFVNLCAGQITDEHIRMWPDPAALQRLDIRQTGDIMIFAAQFGMRHRGRSVRLVREMRLANEFGLGALAVAAMLLVHPERVNSEADLGIDCAGDNFYLIDDDGDVSAESVWHPIFFFHEGTLKFGENWSGHVLITAGAASMIAP